MGGKIGWALALGMLVIGPSPAQAASPDSLQMLEGCLKSTSPEATARLAERAHAKPYSEARRQRELKTSSTSNPERSTGRIQQTVQTVTAFNGWDLLGRGAGALEEIEERSEIFWTDKSTGKAVTPVRTSVSRSCTLEAPVANARAVFEHYERLTDRRYGLRISSDRKWIDVFMFHPDRYDIELNFFLETPIPGLPRDADDEQGRIVLSDGGPRLINEVNPGIPTVTLTRADLLSALDGPAAMYFVNMVIRPLGPPLLPSGDQRSSVAPSTPN